MTRIVTLSDMHGLLPVQFPDGDVLCIAGDVCPVWNHERRFQADWLRGEFADWLNAAQSVYKYVIGVGGNHDFVLEESKGLAFELPWVFLNNRALQVEDVLYWGTPLSGRYGRWAFMKDEDDLAKEWVEIPEGVDVVISHGPPKGWGDRCANGYNAGSPSLQVRLSEVRPKLTIVGHIHEARGAYDAPFGKLINTSSVDLNYKPVTNPFHTFDI